MENHSPEIESFIETVQKQIVGTMLFVTEEDWTVIPYVKERTETGTFHQTLTLRSVKYASSLVEMVFKEGIPLEGELKDFVEALLEPYYLFDKRYTYYFKNVEISALMASKQKRKDDVPEGSSQSKSKDIADEMAFQSFLTDKMIGMTTIVKKIRSLDSTTSVVIPIFNDTPIPLVMRVSVEQKHPQIIALIASKLEKKSEKVSDEA